MQPAKGGNLVTPKLKQLAIGWLYCQGLLACAWWVLLFYAPSLRRHFLPTDAPDSTLLAFMVPDLLLFIGGALVAATGLVRGQRWGWYALLVHSGAAAYAALYCLALPLLSDGGLAGALLMFPSLIVTPYFAWRLKSEGEK